MPPSWSAMTGYRATETEQRSLKELADSETDKAMQEMLHNEYYELKEQLAALAEELKVLLLPKDPNDDKNVILEIRAGAGGEEAGCSAPSSCACTCATPRASGGRSRRSRAITPISAASRKSCS